LKLKELDRYFRELLPIDEFEGTDPSLNGIQISRIDEDIKKVAFTVDASMEAFRRACDWGADILFVHHGLLWGNKAMRIDGIYYRRLKFLLEHDLALYAVHLPLDMHPEYGNNAGLVKLLNLTDVEPFGEYRGCKIGFKGKFKNRMSFDEILQILGAERQACAGLLQFGPEEITTVGIVSGSAPKEIEQAIQEELDLFLTGEISHENYHLSLEGNINLIAAGHYKTEIWGVKQLSEKLKEDRSVETCFMDIPTGL